MDFPIIHNILSQNLNFQDVASKILELANSAPHTTCVMSCNGVLRAVELNLGAAPGETMKYEVHSLISSLSNW